MRPLTDTQRKALLRRLERELAWAHAGPSSRAGYRDVAESIVSGLEWSGVHGASEKRAIELVVARIEEEAAS